MSKSYDPDAIDVVADSMLPPLAQLMRDAEAGLRTLFRDYSHAFLKLDCMVENGEKFDEVVGDFRDVLSDSADRIDQAVVTLKSVAEQYRETQAVNTAGIVAIFDETPPED